MKIALYPPGDGVNKKTIYIELKGDDTMKTAKEFIEKLRTDEAFAKQMNEGVQKKKDAGAPDYVDAILAVAAELGYEVTREQVEGLRAKQEESISEEELGKAAGGTYCISNFASAQISDKKTADIWATTSSC